MEQSDDDSSITEVSSCDTWELISSPYTLRQIRQEIKCELVKTINDDILPQLLQNHVKDLNFSDNGIKTIDKEVVNQVRSLKNEIVKDVLEVVRHEIMPEILEKVNQSIVTKKLATHLESVNRLITNFDVTLQSVPIIMKSFHPFYGKFSPIINLIRNILINCWSNNWTGSLVISSDSKNYSEIICELLKRIRGLFDHYTLGVTIIEIKGCELRNQKIDKDYSDKYDYTVYNGWRINERISLDIRSFENDLKKVLINQSKIFCISENKENTITFQDEDLFGKYIEFSNHHLTAIKIRDEIWPTPLHYIEAQKYTSQSIRKQIRMASTIEKVLTLSRNYSSQQRKDWDSFLLSSSYKLIATKETPKHEAFHIALTSKFDQHPHLKFKLLSTRSLPIKHLANDVDCNTLDLVNKNFMGKTLENVRNLFMEIECKKAAGEFIEGDEKMIMEEVRETIWKFKGA
ncbi:5702_t:CDS:2 [Cetraspora pellucida]|uniref:5702_t:CDS:1 n=1 Tax=Cetraspora pellucida TaxID=1433469 RepID=A0A9N9AHD9_9GLOM|nr:5702_t:CDS:2 [Cetraspora pellucida]